jgi:hypothetical protein
VATPWGFESPRPHTALIGVGFRYRDAKGTPPLIGCRCMAWWRRGRRGNRDSAWLILFGERCRRGEYHGRLSRSCCGCGCWRRAGSGAVEPCWVCCDAGGAPAGAAVPMGWFSVGIPENAPGRRGCRRRAAGYGPEKDSAVTAAPGAPCYRVRPQRPRGGGGRCGVRGAGAGRSGAAVRGAAAARSGAPRSRAQLPSGLPGPARVDEVWRAQPRPVRSAFPAPAFPSLALWSQSCDARSITRRRRRDNQAAATCA